MTQYMVEVVAQEDEDKFLWDWEWEMSGEQYVFYSSDVPASVAYSGGAWGYVHGEDEAIEKAKHLFRFYRPSSTPHILCSVGEEITEEDLVYAPQDDLPWY